MSCLYCKRKLTIMEKEKAEESLIEGGANEKETSDCQYNSFCSGSEPRDRELDLMKPVVEQVKLLNHMG